MKTTFIFLINILVLLYANTEVYIYPLAISSSEDGTSSNPYKSFMSAYNFAKSSPGSYTFNIKSNISDMSSNITVDFPLNIT